MTSEAAFISCPLSSHLAIQYLCLSVNLFTTLPPMIIFLFLFFTSLPFALWFHIWEAEPYNGSALLFASVSLCSIWSCERAGEGGCWMIWTLACCSVFVQAALCFALRLRDTKRKISSISSSWAQMDERNRGYFPHGTLYLSWLSVTFCLHPFLIPTSIKRGIREYFCVASSINATTKPASEDFLAVV